MLSLSRCREVLAGESARLSDEQVTQLRDQLYALAETAVQLAHMTPPVDFSLAAASLTTEVRADVEERAAIIEFDGRLSRDQAERFALSRHLRTPPQ